MGIRPSYLKISNPTFSRISSHCNRHFSSGKPSFLLYQPKAKGPKPNITGGRNDGKKKQMSLLDAEDAEKDARLMKNKYYMNSPKFFRPFLKEIMLRPVGFGFSIVILQQFSVIVPFLLLWYYYFQTDKTPKDLPKDSYQKGLDTITKGLVNLDMDDASKAKMAVAGAASYALTKALLPVRIPICVLLAPWFDRWCLRPIGQIFRLLFGRSKIVKPRFKK